MDRRKLKFVNFDATPKTVELVVSSASIPPIMEWYGSHFSGDRYTVLVDGEKVGKDRNGRMIGLIPK